MVTGTVGRRRALLCLAVLRDDGQRLLERVRRPAIDRCAALHGRRRGALFVGVLASQSSRERRGKPPIKFRLLIHIDALFYKHPSSSIYEAASTVASRSDS